MKNVKEYINKEITLRLESLKEDIKGKENEICRLENDSDYLDHLYQILTRKKELEDLITSFESTQSALKYYEHFLTECYKLDK
jgi:predicted nuclease with TOPRIM domain